MFTTQTWPYCKTAKEFLSKNKIDYTEKNVDLDEEALKEMMNMNISGVPTFLIGEEVVIGLDKEKILELVK